MSRASGGMTGGRKRGLARVMNRMRPGERGKPRGALRGLCRALRVPVPVCGLALGLTAPASAQVAVAPDRPQVSPLLEAQAEVFRAAAERVAPSVVTIETIGGTQPPARRLPNAPGGQPRPGLPAPRPTGSGFVIADGPTTGLIYSADGLILTSAFNFVRDPSIITVVLPDGRRFVGELLARDEVRKLAMLKIEADNLPVPQWLDDPDDLRIGQWAIALGRGFGAVVADPGDRRPGRDPSLTVGIVSAVDRMGGLCIQTDANTSPANFGGPLIDIEGRVLGLCVPMGVGSSQMAGVEWYDSGVGFAIDRAQVERSARDLAVGHSLRRGLIGVALDTEVKEAVRIVGVADPSPAGRADLRVGDQITAIDGEPINNLRDLRRALQTRMAGEWIKLTIQRGETEFERELVLAVSEDLGSIPRQTPDTDDDSEASPESPESRPEAD